MFKSAVLVTAAAAALGVQTTPLDEATPAVRQSLIDEINAARTTWRAAIPVKFQNATLADVKRLLGTIMPGEHGYMADLNMFINYSCRNCSSHFPLIIICFCDWRRSSAVTNDKN